MKLHIEDNLIQFQLKHDDLVKSLKTASDSEKLIYYLDNFIIDKYPHELPEDLSKESLEKIVSLVTNTIHYFDVHAVCYSVHEKERNKTKLLIEEMIDKEIKRSEESINELLKNVLNE